MPKQGGPTILVTKIDTKDQQSLIIREAKGNQVPDLETQK